MRAKDGVPPTPSAQQMDAMIEFDKLVIAKTKAYYGDPLSEIEEYYSKKIGMSIMSGQGTGKDAVNAWFCWKFLTCFSYAKIPATAPSAHQLRDIVWSEMAKWIAYSPIKDFFEIQTDKIYFKEAEGKRWFMIARTANPKDSLDEQAETLAGLHEDYMLIVATEASGISDPVYKPLEGTLTGKLNLVNLIFNPTRAKGYAHDSQFKERESWIALRWNAEESEIVSRDHIEYMAKKYGRDSNTYRIRVLGLPPRMDELTLLDPEWVYNAVGRDIAPLDTDEEFMIIDVGAGGDETVMTRRRGPNILEIKAYTTSNSEILTNWLMSQIFTYQPAMVLIDPIGVGWGIAGNLRSRMRDTLIIDVNVTELPTDDQRFFRMRDELWWNLKEEFEHGTISIPDDAMLQDELLAIRLDQKMYEQKGVIKIESKRDMIKRGVESPNRGDTLAMSEYFGIETMRRMKTRPTARRGSQTNWRVA
jgi:hypothetical protein